MRLEPMFDCFDRRRTLHLKYLTWQTVLTVQAALAAFPGRSVHHCSRLAFAQCSTKQSTETASHQSCAAIH